MLGVSIGLYSCLKINRREKAIERRRATTPRLQRRPTTRINTTGAWMPRTQQLTWAGRRRRRRRREQKPQPAAGRRP